MLFIRQLVIDVVLFLVMLWHAATPSSAIVLTCSQTNTTTKTVRYQAHVNWEVF